MDALEQRNHSSEDDRPRRKIALDLRLPWAVILLFSTSCATPHLERANDTTGSSRARWSDGVLVAQACPPNSSCRGCVLKGDEVTCGGVGVKTAVKVVATATAATAVKEVTKRPCTLIESRGPGTGKPGGGEIRCRYLCGNEIVEKTYYGTPQTCIDRAPTY